MIIRSKRGRLTSLYLSKPVQGDTESSASTPTFTHASEKLPSVRHTGDLDSIDELNEQFERSYDKYFSTDPLLSRGLVSFQANKSRAVYRWYKFKEAFSAGLVEYLLTRYGIGKGTLLDPFAGSGTALFASSETGLSAEGIELLPIGHRIVETKRLIEASLGPAHVRALSKWISKAPWRKTHPRKPLPELRITKGAYPEETADSIRRFLTAINDEDDTLRSILLFALLCILEVISFTRKDGQYLRWDHRSGRRQGKKIFNKGLIPSFDDAMQGKLRDILSDFSPNAPQQQLFPQNIKPGEINLHRGSCLDLLPKLPECSYDCIITSPPSATATTTPELTRLNLLF
jgi:hypothetical protein